MDFKRITANIVEIDGVTYIRHEVMGLPVDDIKNFVRATLRRNGELSQGVIINRCRKWGSKDVREALEGLVSSGDIECRSSVHAQTKLPVFYYSLINK